MTKNELKKFQENYINFTPGVPGTEKGGLPAEGLRLACHFDQKNEVKAFGARWNPHGTYWWLPSAEVESGRMPLEELNDRKMSNGWHGPMVFAACEAWVKGTYPDKDYKLIRELIRGEKVEAWAKIKVWTQHDLVSEEYPSVTIWRTIEAARDNWNLLMDSDYRRVTTLSPVSS